MSVVWLGIIHIRHGLVRFPDFQESYDAWFVKLYTKYKYIMFINIQKLHKLISSNNLNSRLFNILYNFVSRSIHSQPLTLPYNFQWFMRIKQYMKCQWIFIVLLFLSTVITFSFLMRIAIWRQRSLYWPSIYTMSVLWSLFPWSTKENREICQTYALNRELPTIISWMKLV